MKIVVTVADGHLGQIEAVADRLRHNGMEVAQVLGPIGVITGTAQPGWEALGDLDGVAAVEPEREARER